MNTENGGEEALRCYIVSELDAVLAEMRVPMNRGLIAEAKIRHLQEVLAAWPNVTINGKPAISSGVC
jgi:hypothetical protein